LVQKGVSRSFFYIVLRGPTLPFKTMPFDEISMPKTNGVFVRPLTILVVLTSGGRLPNMTTASLALGTTAGLQLVAMPHAPLVVFSQMLCAEIFKLKTRTKTMTQKFEKRWGVKNFMRVGGQIGLSPQGRSLLTLCNTPTGLCGQSVSAVILGNQAFAGDGQSRSLARLKTAGRKTAPTGGTIIPKFCV
jgi:hypothetical protein